MNRAVRLTAPADGRRPGAAYQPELSQALSAYQEAVVRLRALDWTTTELVRLRCARTHDCRICSTLRLVPALEAGVDEALLDKVDYYETSDLSERHKVALRLADAHLTGPATITEQLAADVQRHFSPAEIVEILTDVSKWSYQKAMVALGLDDVPDGITVFDVDEAGKVRFGAAVGS